MNKTILGVIAGVLAVFLSNSVFANDSLESRVAALENDTAKIKVGGQLQLDAGRWFDDTASAGLEDGINIRRARLGVSGDIGDGWGYKLEIDAADSITTQDAIISKRTQIGDITVEALAGHHKAGTSIDENTSSENITFMERAMSSNISGANFGSRRLGGSLVLNLPHTYIHTGIFGRELSGSTNQMSWNTRAMVTGLEDRIGLGGSYAQLLERENSATHTLRYRDRPETRVDGDHLIDTGNITAESVNHYGVSGFLTYGSLHGHGEYFIENITINSTTDRSLNGYYGQAGYILTGEQRTWNPQRATWNSINPSNDIGAIEVAYRYSYQDLNDVTIAGGIETNHTGALNWYPRKNVKLGLNVIRGTFDDANESKDFIFGGLRTQISF